MLRGGAGLQLDTTTSALQTGVVTHVQSGGSSLCGYAAAFAVLAPVRRHPERLVCSRRPLELGERLLAAITVIIYYYAVCSLVPHRLRG